MTQYIPYRNDSVYNFKPELNIYLEVKIRDTFEDKDFF